MRSLLIMAILWLALALPGLPAWAKGCPGPVIPPCTPTWTIIPGVSGVQYAPNIKSDLFRYQGTYYCQQRGSWYQGNAVQGPWTVLQEPPAVFYQIQAPYFKVPPGWARGKKAGWRGAAMPPGQMKKNGYTGDRIPPGQLKKMAP
jgi:hypothetical protein